MDQELELNEKKSYKAKKKAPKLLSEKQIHKAFANFVKTVYPDVIFWSDMSGLKVSIGTASEMAAVRSSKSIPDIFFAIPKGEFKGLFMELKAERSDAFKVDGSIRETEHIQDQAKMLDRLSHLGYEAVFACGLDECQKIFEGYMRL